MHEEEKTPNPHEQLQASTVSLSKRLDRVTDVTVVPQERQFHALLRACKDIKKLLPHLERLPDPWNYGARMTLANVPNALICLEIEVQLLRTICNKNQTPTPCLLETRCLLQQQVAVRREGQKLLRRLAEVQRSLQPSG